MAGAVLTETIFSWPGVGNWLIESISRRDYPALQGGVLLVSAVVIFVNLIVDLLYGVDQPENPPWPLTSPLDGRRDEAAPVLAQPSPLAAFWAAFRENRGAMIGLASSRIVVLLAIFADVVAPHSPIEQFRDAVRAPPVWAGGGSWRFVLGTDGDGHDMLSRLIFGARVSLFIGVVGDERLASSSASRSGLLAAMAGSIVDVVDHAADGPHHGGAEPGAGDPRRRDPRAEPRQHHRRGDDRLPAALRAPGARLGARRTAARTT